MSEIIRDHYPGLLNVRKSHSLQRKRYPSSQRKYTHTHKTYIYTYIFTMTGSELEWSRLRKKDKPGHLIINREESPTYLVTARVQMVTRKQPATIIQPHPPSGGEVDRDLFTFAMASVLFSSFPSYSNSPVMILEGSAVQWFPVGIQDWYRVLPGTWVTGHLKPKIRT